MNLISPQVALLREEDPFIKIERVGRTCYKSSSEFDSQSSVKFFKMLEAQNHFAMLEHAVFHFCVPEMVYQIYTNHPQPHIRTTEESFRSGKTRYLISGNLRAIAADDNLLLMNGLLEVYGEDIFCQENDKHLRRDYIVGSPLNCMKVQLVDLKHLVPRLTQKEKETHYDLTMLFTCDRGVSHELVRHRVASFAQESTRYCNYSKSKYSHEITFIEPSGFDNWSAKSRAEFFSTLSTSEKAYFNMLDEGCTPQEARAVLPNALKTEVVMTMYLNDWKHFFDLRYHGVTGSPHPDMVVVAKQAYALCQNVVGVSF